MLESIVTVPVVTACLVAAARKLGGVRPDGRPRLDGAWLMVALASAAGALVASVLNWWPLVVVWLDARPWAGVPVRGAATAFVAVGGIELLRGAASRVQSVSIDARTVGPEARKRPDEGETGGPP